MNLLAGSIPWEPEPIRQPARGGTLRGDTALDAFLSHTPICRMSDPFGGLWLSPQNHWWVLEKNGKWVNNTGVCILNSSKVKGKGKADIEAYIREWWEGSDNPTYDFEVCTGPSVP